MPVAITIGVDPALFISMVLKVPPGTDKLEVAGGLGGKGIEVMSSPQSGIEVPVAGELLLVDFTEEERHRLSLDVMIHTDSLPPLRRRLQGREKGKSKETALGSR